MERAVAPDHPDPATSAKVDAANHRHDGCTCFGGWPEPSRRSFHSRPDPRAWELMVAPHRRGNLLRFRFETTRPKKTGR